MNFNNDIKSMLDNGNDYEPPAKSYEDANYLRVDQPTFNHQHTFNQQIQPRESYQTG